MSTYDHSKVLADYAATRITPEMAVGHSLQHIAKLYDSQNEARASRLSLQSQLDQVEKRLHTLQMAVERLTAFMEKVQRLQQKRSTAHPPSAG